MCWEEQCWDGGKGGIWWNRLGTGPQVEKVKSSKSLSSLIWKRGLLHEPVLLVFNPRTLERPLSTAAAALLTKVNANCVG